MEHDEAVRLVAPAIAPVGGTWADLGAGTGTFTRALASLLGEKGRVIAIDREAAHVRALERLARRRDPAVAEVAVMHADFTAPLPLPRLDGALLANALHFVASDAQAALLASLAARVALDGRIAIVEYENRAASRWVPYPVSFARFVELAHEAGLAPPVRAGERRSAYGGTMYAAYASVVSDE